MSDPLWHDLELFLGSQTQDQRHKLAEVILNFDPTKTHVQSQMRKISSKSASVKKAKTAKTAVKAPELSLAAKRPLNSWMAFRCFYAAIFISHQQKEISGLLTRMWQGDPFKAKWTIVAKAYSTIRDRVGKTQAPLSEFLQIVCPLVGIVGPAEYLEKLGWMKPHGQEMVRCFIPDVKSFDAHLRTTELSADDVVQHCREIGYFSSELKTNASTAGKASLAMAVEPNAGSLTPMLVAPTSHTDIDILGANNIFDVSTGAEWDVFGAPMGENVAAFENMGENSALLDFSGDSYPFNDQFEPEDFSAGLGLSFDPICSEEFEAFDIGSFVDSEAFWRL